MFACGLKATEFFFLLLLFWICTGSAVSGSVLLILRDFMFRLISLFIWNIYIVTYFFLFGPLLPDAISRIPPVLGFPVTQFILF
jgi:hypothetical protein